MLRMRSSLWIAAVLCINGTLGAQQSPDSLARAQLRAQQRALDSLAQAVRDIQSRFDSLQRVVATPPPPAPAAASGAYMNVSFVGLTSAGTTTADDIQSLEVGDHDPKVRGFSIPNGELSLDGAVDPYFKGFANIAYKLDAAGETGVELEEMFALSSALPLNLQLKIGQFFAEFGRQNNQHPHAWAFADQNLVLGRMFGREGLRSQGARLSWLLPTSFYTEASMAVMNSAGGTTSSFRSEEAGAIHGGVPIDRPVRGFGDMLFVPRVATSLDPTDNTTLVVGISGAFGPNNSGPTARTSLYGTDVYWKWKSPRAAKGFPFVSLQSEFLARAYDAAARPDASAPLTTLPAETLRDRGAYGQILWGIRPMLVAGLRAEFVHADPAFFLSDERTNRTRYSTDITLFPTEYSKLRLQYNYDRRPGIGNDHSLWAQFEFLLGAHAAHKF